METRVAPCILHIILVVDAIPDTLLVIGNVGAWMPVYVTLVNDQLDAQFFYFIIRLLQSSTCFEQRRAHHQEVKLY